MRPVSIVITFLFYSLANCQPLIPYLQDSLYGFSDIEGNIVIKPQFDEVDFFDVEYKYTSVKIGDKWYVINNKGKKISNTSYGCKPVIEPMKDYGKDISKIHQVSGIRPQTFPTCNIIVINRGFHCRNRERYREVFSLNNFKSIKILEPINLRHYEDERGPYSYFTQGHLFAALGENKFAIYDEDLKLILESSIMPYYVKGNLYIYFDGQEHIYDPNTKKSKKIPFPYLEYFSDYDIYVFCNFKKTSYLFGDRIRCGVCDTDFNIKIGSLYTTIEPHQEGYIGTIRGRKFPYNLVNSEGNSILSDKKKIKHIAKSKYLFVKDSLDKIKILNNELSNAIDDEFDDLIWNENYSSFSYNKGDLAGILDSNFNKIIEGNADKIISTSSPNLFSISIDNKYGIIDLNNQIILPIHYSSVSIDSTGNIRMRSIKTLKTGLANKNGKVIIDTLYDSIDYISLNSERFIKADGNGSLNFFDLIGRRVNILNKIHISKASRKNQNTFHSISKEQHRSLLHNRSYFKRLHKNELQAKTVLLYKGENDSTYAYKSDFTHFNDGILEKVSITKWNEKNKLLAYKTNSGEGILDSENKVILKAGDRKISDLHDNYIIIWDKQKRFTFYDLNMKRIHPFSYDAIEQDCSDCALRRVSRRIPGSAYEVISESCISNTIDTLTNYKYRHGFLDRLGKIFIPPIYDYADNFNEEYASVGSYNQDSIIQSLIIDTLGNEIKKFDLGIKPINWHPRNEYFQAKKFEKHGYMDSDFNVIIDFQYKWIKDIHEAKLFSVGTSEEGTWQLINRHQKVIYDEITKLDYINYYGRVISLKDNLVLVSPNGKMQIIDFETGEKGAFFHAEAEKIEFIEIHDIPLIKAKKDGYTFYVHCRNSTVYKN